MDQMIESIIETARAGAELATARTYCSQFCVDFLKESTNFTCRRIQYESNGMSAVYHCDIDGRLYDVRITPRRD